MRTRLAAALGLAFLIGVLAATATLGLVLRPHVVGNGPRCMDQLIGAMVAHGGERWDQEAAHLREMGVACDTRYIPTTDYLGTDP